MPITKSAIKALRQSHRRRVRNTARKNAYKKVTKEFKQLLSSGKNKEAASLVSRLYQSLDKAAKTHTIAKNKASRLKSRLTKKLQKASS